MQTQTPPPRAPRTPRAPPQELGVSVLSDLQRQRETIAHSREALGGMDASIGQARQVLSAMSRRVTQHKAVMWGVIALLGASIVMVLWAKLAR